MKACSAAAVAIVLSLLAACGGNGGGTQSLGPIKLTHHDASGGWLGSDRSSVDFVQLTEAKDGSLAGSITDAEAAPDDSGTPVKVSNYSVTGFRHGSSIALTVNAGLGVTQTWNGTFSQSEITLQVTQTDGSIASESLSPGDVDAYNGAVSSLRTKVVEAQQTAAEQQQAAQEEQQRQAAAAALTKAKGDFTVALYQLRGALPSLSVAEQLAPGLAAVRSALGQTHADGATAKGLAGPTADCDTVSNAVQRVSDDVDALSTSQGLLSDAVDTVKQAASTVSDAADNASSAEQALREAGGPIDQESANLIISAGKQASAASSAADADYAVAQDLYTQAEQVFSDTDPLSNDCNFDT